MKWGIDRARNYATPAANQYPGQIGINIHNGWSTAQFNVLLGQAATNGMGWARIGINWNTVQAAQGGAFTWTQPDLFMTAAAQSGLSGALLLAVWSNNNQPTSVSWPPANADVKAFFQGIANRYGAGGSFWSANPSLTPIPIAIEMGNELYLSSSWNGNAPSASAAAGCLVGCAAAIKAIDSTIKVGLPATMYYNGASNWIIDMFAAQATIFASVDFLSAHNYVSPNNLMMGLWPLNGTWPVAPVQFIPNQFGPQVAALSRAVYERNGSAIPIWLTEFGATTDLPGDSMGVTTAQQAVWIRQYLQQGLRRHASYAWGAGIQKMFVYDVSIATGIPGDNQGNYGLLTAGSVVGTTLGASTLNWKPAWSELVAYSRLT